jgi:L-threonylcarbamoyladenylate synthase
MKTQVLATAYAAPDGGVLDRGARVLARGGLVAFAAETVYGLGCDALNADAAAAIFAAKGRAAGNPLIVHVKDVEQARSLAACWPAEAERLARVFWPGPLTLVVPRSRVVPDATTGARDTVGLRVPASPVALGLIERLGSAIAAPSANRSNHVSPTRAEHVLDDLDGLIDLVIDSGPTAIGLESTVLDLSSRPWRVLRPGPITWGDLETLLGGDLLAGPGAAQEADVFASPGRQPVHYAPRTPAFRLETAEELAGLGQCEDLELVVLGPRERWPQLIGEGVVYLESPVEAARAFYETLRRLDARGPRAIVIAAPPDEAAWSAVRDRLWRATRVVGESGEAVLGS